MRIAKGTIGVVVGIILWFVGQLALAFIIAALAVGTGTISKVFNWLASTDTFGHLFTVLLFSLPCALPAWVAKKITLGDGKLTKVTMWVMVAIISIIGFVFFWQSDIITALEAIFGMVCTHMVIMSEK